MVRVLYEDRDGVASCDCVGLGVRNRNVLLGAFQFFVDFDLKKVGANHTYFDRAVWYNEGNSETFTHNQHLPF